MLTKPYQLHPEALRDALGLARTLYAVTKAKGDDPVRLHAIIVAGESLRKALAMAMVTHPPDTMGGRAASAHAVTGFQALHGVRWSDDVAQLVREAERRALGTG